MYRELNFKLSEENGNFEGIEEIKGFTFCDSFTSTEKIVRIALFQNAIVEKNTTAPISCQRDALLKLGEQAVNLASKCGVQIFCFQECWSKE